MDNQAVYDYWQHGKQLNILNNQDISNYKDSFRFISRTQCTNGHIEDQQLLTELLKNGSQVVVAPYYATQLDRYFVPALVVLNLCEDGKFTPVVPLATPFVPNTVLEPSTKFPFALGNTEDFENYLIMHPPIWYEDPNRLNWSQQIKYLEQLLANAMQPDWEMLCAQAEYTVANDAFVFPLSAICKPGRFDLSLLDEPDKITLFDAPRNSGKTAYASRIIVQAWIDAALKELPPPKYVLLEDQSKVQYSTIDAWVQVGPADSTHNPLIELSQRFETFEKGLQAIDNWRNVSGMLLDKYSDKGGIVARLEALQTNIKDARAHKRHLEVLYSIWQRQLELTRNWNKVFDFVPYCQNQRLQRLYNFFKQNFPQDKVAGLNIKQLEELLQEKLRRCDRSERFVADALHQVENDLYQEALLRDKCLQWCQSQGITFDVIEDMQQHLDQIFWRELAVLAAKYWQEYFKANADQLKLMQSTTNQIDMLILEHAEYIDPMFGAELLAKSQRVIAMGNYNPMPRSRYATQIDYELVKFYDLATNDAEYEDLQFDGYLAATGNMWNLLAQGREANQIFNQFASNIQYQYVDHRTPSSIVSGSLVNQGCIMALITWLDQHANWRDKIAIYTCFSVQAQMVRSSLSSTLFSQIPVYLVQDPQFTRNPINIFLPVYTANDSGPYNFDRGSEILANLVDNTSERLVIIGDMQIFKPELHSAVGNFAKRFINIPTKISEIESV